METSVYFVDDHPIVLAGLKQFFTTVPGIRFSGSVRDGREFLDRFDRGDLPKIDVLVLDIDIPGIDGIQLFGMIQKRKPELPVLFYTRQPEDQFALQLLQRGAAGFLSKDRETDMLIDAIRIAHCGEVYMTPKMAGLLVGRTPDTTEAHHLLSPREKEVFELFICGASPGNVAKELAISASTVSSYLKRIREKLGVESTQEIVQYAYRHGLIR